MEIKKEQLLKRIKELEQQEQMHIGQINSLRGARKECQRLLEVLDAEEPKEEPKDGPKIIKEDGEQ